MTRFSLHPYRQPCPYHQGVFVWHGRPKKRAWTFEPFFWGTVHLILGGFMLYQERFMLGRSVEEIFSHHPLYYLFFVPFFALPLAIFLGGIWEILSPFCQRLSYRLAHYWLTTEEAIIEVRMGWLWRVYALPRESINEIYIRNECNYYTVHLGGLKRWWSFSQSSILGKDENLMPFEFFCLTRQECDALLALFPPGLIKVWSKSQKGWVPWYWFCAQGLDAYWENNRP